jgi:hypothetical protein
MEGLVTQHAWLQRFAGAVTVCDAHGIILEMNDKALETFRDQGGQALIGTDLFACHPEPSRTKLRQVMDARQTNVYTIEKAGRRKLIYQAPWYAAGGEYGGYVEVALEIPTDLPHFLRQP